MRTFASTAEFAAERRTIQDQAIEDLTPYVNKWLADIENADLLSDLLDEVATLYADTYTDEGGERSPRFEAFLDDLDVMLNKTTDEADPTLVATMLAVSTTNAATVQAAGDDQEFVVMEWVSMEDERVRDTHVLAEGQQRPPGEKFDVGTAELPYPGWPGGPLEETANCRCVLSPVLGVDAARLNEAQLASGGTMTEPDDTTEGPAAVPWHGVLAPEGVWSGDGRMFNEGSLSHRDLPLPLTWQKASSEGHGGSVVVAKIDRLARVDGEYRGSGAFLVSEEADEVIGMVAEFGKFGVSVDADEAEFEFSDDDEDRRVKFTKARVASASIVAIPAFQEAFIMLGDPPEGFLPEEEPEVDEEELTEPLFAVSEQPWDGSASRFSEEQWKASTIVHVCDGPEKSCHKLPIKEPGGALSRAGVHAAAARLNQVDAPPEAKSRAKAALRGAYKTLGEEAPDVIKASLEEDLIAAMTEAIDEFKDLAPGRTEDGPGWLTHPVDTDRLRDYWTRGAGAAKIAWGTPGDFNRCRANLAEYVKPQYLSGYCANRHFDALGFWPGEHHAGDNEPFNGDPNDLRSIGFVASATGVIKAPAAWFTDPGFEQVTHLTVTEEGQVFGHLAEWGACHIGFEGECVAPPSSASDYAYYANKAVMLDDGSMASTGPIMLGDGGHARLSMRSNQAQAHYDKTSVAVADVCVGEDAFGIWCAGWIRPGTTPEQVAALRGSDVSGDWREIPYGSGQAEMVAALAVNVGGFATPQVRIENGTRVSLVAAGVVHKSEDDGTADMLADLAERTAAAMEERQARREKIKELAARVEGGQ